MMTTDDDMQEVANNDASFPTKGCTTGTDVGKKEAAIWFV